MKNKLYLVTGATGFLGNNVCRRLAEQGMRIRALVMDGDPAEKHLPEGVEVVHGDLLESASLDRFFDADGNDEVYVIHCASIVWVKLEANPKVHAVNVDGTANIIDQCVRHRVRKLVYVSSTGAIPERCAGEKIKEIPHNTAARLTVPFPTSAACRFLDLPPVNLRNLQLHLSKNSLAS